MKVVTPLLECVVDVENIADQKPQLVALHKNQKGIGYLSHVELRNVCLLGLENSAVEML